MVIHGYGRRDLRISDRRVASLTEERMAKDAAKLSDFLASIPTKTLVLGLAKFQSDFGASVPEIVIRTK